MNLWNWKNADCHLNPKSYSQKPSWICSWATSNVLEKAFSTQDLANAVITCGSQDLCGCQALAWSSLHRGSCAGRLCRQGCLATPRHEHTSQQWCSMSAPLWRSSLLPKSTGSYLLPQTSPAHAGGCPQELQAGESSQFPLLMKAASTKVEPPSPSGFSRLLRLCPSRWAAQTWRLQHTWSHHAGGLTVFHGSGPSVSQPGRGSRHAQVQDKRSKSFFSLEKVGFVKYVQWNLDIWWL